MNLWMTLRIGGGWLGLCGGQRDAARSPKVLPAQPTGSALPAYPPLLCTRMRTWPRRTLPSPESTAPITTTNHFYTEIQDPSSAQARALAKVERDPGW